MITNYGKLIAVICYKKVSFWNVIYYVTWRVDLWLCMVNAIQNQNLLITAHVLCINLVDCYLQL